RGILIEDHSGDVVVIGKVMIVGAIGQVHRALAGDADEPQVALPAVYEESPALARRHVQVDCLVAGQNIAVLDVQLALPRRIRVAAAPLSPEAADVPVEIP